MSCSIEASGSPTSLSVQLKYASYSSITFSQVFMSQKFQKLPTVFNLIKVELNAE